MRVTGDTLPQTRLALELRMLTDTAMQVDPVGGKHHDALVKLKRMIAANPVGFRSSHVTWNMGQKRMDWIEKVL